MASLAPRPHGYGSSAQADRGTPSLPPQFADYTFLQENAEKVVQLTMGLSEYLRTVFAPDADQGLSHFAELWNRAHARKQLRDPEQRKILVDTYHWLKQRAAREDRYRERLADFINSALRDEELQRSPFSREAAAVRIDRIEASMAGLGRAIEHVQPEVIIKEGAGKLYVRWESSDALLSWGENFEQPIGLRDASSRAFSLYGEFSRQITACLASAFLNSVQITHCVLPPNFEFPPGLEAGTPPDYWRWTRPTRPNGPVALPNWIEDNVPANLPNPIELDLSARQPKLASLLDELLVAAALQDVQDRRHDAVGENIKQVPSAVEQLVEITACVANRPRAEVAEIFGRSLQRRQSKAENEMECAANTEALQFLWSQLSETI